MHTRDSSLLFLCPRSIKSSALLHAHTDTENETALPINSIVLTLPPPYSPSMIQVRKLSLADVQKTSHSHTVVALQRRALKFAFWSSEKKDHHSLLSWHAESGRQCPGIARQLMLLPLSLWMLGSISLVQDNPGKVYRGNPHKGKNQRSVVLIQTTAPVVRHQGRRKRKEKMCVHLHIIMHLLWGSETPLKDGKWTKDAQPLSDLNIQHSTNPSSVSASRKLSGMNLNKSVLFQNHYLLFY